MNPLTRRASIVIAEDDVDDQMFILRALKETAGEQDVHVVSDGEELMDLLNRRGSFEEKAEKPGLILLDLNMPRKSGREVLAEMKEQEGFRSIPIIVLTTSSSEVDIQESYNNGANAYVVKPVSYSGLVEAIGSISNFWLRSVMLPLSDPTPPLNPAT